MSKTYLSRPFTTTRLSKGEFASRPHGRRRPEGPQARLTASSGSRFSVVMPLSSRATGETENETRLALDCAGGHRSRADLGCRGLELLFAASVTAQGPAVTTYARLSCQDRLCGMANRQGSFRWHSGGDSWLVATGAGTNYLISPCGDVAERLKAAVC
jgi:hypothetical protein